MENDFDFKIIFAESPHNGKHKNMRSEKGKSIVNFPDDFVVIDLETTGLSPSYDEIIELGAIKVINGKVVDTFQTLCKPKFEIDEYIESLTGITNEMVADAPSIEEVFKDFISFVGNNIVVGHNVNFDVNFVYDNSIHIFGSPFSNDFIDTMRISKALLPELKHHRLKDLIEYFKVKKNQMHRSLSDCEYTLETFEKLKNVAIDKYGELDRFLNQYTNSGKKKWQNSDLRALTSENTSFNESNPLYNKYCVFTGVLERFSRKEAAQIVVNLGGSCENTVTQKTNYLILGNNDYCKSIKDGKSSKQKKAESLILKGKDLTILPESEFYEMILSNEYWK